MARVLLVEDDEDISKMERILLREAGYEVSPAFSGTEALLHMERQAFDLVLLDLMLPGMDGEEVLGKLRKTWDVPVICVSAKDDVRVRVDLIRKGADDYLTKPFDNDELLARIEAVLRRRNGVAAGGRDGAVLHCKDLELNPNTFEVKLCGKGVNLTKREFAILELLMGNPNKVFTKNNIYASVWDADYVGEDNAVNVHVSNIRMKLAKLQEGEEYIQTVWGIGFKMHV